jgi:two-component system response regulator LytT
MRLLIVEDEPPIADHIEWMCQKILGSQITSCKKITSLDHALEYIRKKPTDLLLLDLNLEGENGFDILKNAISGSFHTIIISAYTEQAITAFQYGVLDFIPKPFNEKRLRKAFDRYFNRQKSRDLESKYLAVRDDTSVRLIQIKDVSFFKAAGNYVEIHQTNGNVDLLTKSIGKLEQILPSRFIRVHRSYTVDLHQIDSYKHVGGGRYQIKLSHGIHIPLSRDKHKKLKQMMNR